MAITELYETPESIIGACLSATALAPAEFPPDLPTTPLLLGAPGWYDFEWQAWAIGEAVRRSLKDKPQFRRNVSVTDAICSVAVCRNLRRGRQSFVMSLGYTTAASCSPAIAQLLYDPDVDGHAVDTLLKMQVSGYGAEVADLSRHKHAWIRRLAKRYAERYGVPPN